MGSLAFEDDAENKRTGSGDTQTRTSSLPPPDSGRSSMWDLLSGSPPPARSLEAVDTPETAPPPAVNPRAHGLLPPPVEGDVATFPSLDGPRLSSLLSAPLSEPPPSSKPPSTRRGLPERASRPPSVRMPSNGPFPQEAPSSRVAPANGVPAALAEGQQTFSDHLVQLFKALGVDTAFGLTGGAVAHFSAALVRGKLRVVHCRHEAGAVFAAIESYYVTERPSLVFTTTGPGLTNAITGIAAAHRDGAKLIVISGATAAPQRGRWAFQETSAYTMPVSALFTAGPLFHYAATIEQPVEIFEAVRRIASGLQKPGGFVAHLALPLTTQVAQEFEPVSGGPISMLPLRSAEATAAECAELLRHESFAIWVGFGARHASRQIRELAWRSRAPVMCSPRGKGIFPERDPQFLGVTGFGGHESVFDYMAQRRPSYILVLGTRLGEFTSFWSEDMVPGKGFIHVDVDPAAHGSAYPDVGTIGVQADVRSFVEALLAHFPRASHPPTEYPGPFRSEPVVEPREEGPVRPDFLMRMIQRVIVDNSDAPVITEAGNAFAWGTNLLRFSSPGRYRVSTGFGSMGHAVTGVIGMALARRGKAVAIAGDGAMLMNSEVSTAVRYGIPAVWIVLNDSSYGMIEQGLNALGLPSVETQIPKTDFLMIAQGMGAEAVRVERERDVVPALERAMWARGPFVVDVVIDSRVRAPSGRRFKSLVDDQFAS